MDDVCDWAEMPKIAADPPHPGHLHARRVKCAAVSYRSPPSKACTAKDPEALSWIPFPVKSLQWIRALPTELRTVTAAHLARRTDPRVGWRAREDLVGNWVDDSLSCRQTFDTILVTTTWSGHQASPPY